MPISYRMSRKLKAFPLNSGTRPGCPPSPVLFSIVLEETLATEIRQKKVIKGNDRVSEQLFEENMILCLENPNISSKILLELITKFSNKARYKINVYTKINAVPTY